MKDLTPELAQRQLNKMRAKRERRAMRQQLYKEAIQTLSRNMYSPAQLKQAARIMTDQAISQVTNG